MKFVSWAVVTLNVLAACSSEPKVTPATPETVTVTETDAAPPPPTPDAGPRRGRPEGAMCGGIAGLRCQEDLHCVIDGAVYPDKAGTCQKR